MEVRFLRYAYHDQNIYIHLYPALPIAGVDGTLRNRMRETFTRGNVHAKQALYKASVRFVDI